MKVGIVGKGKAGSSLATALEQNGACLEWFWSRRDGLPAVQLPAVDLILIAVSDRAIVEVAQQLAGRPSASDETWLHLSGFHDGTHCRVDANIPRAAGSFHPLCALNDSPAILQHLQGCVAGIDGDPDAAAIATSLASDLEMIPVQLIPGSKKLYHAAAVTVAGHVTALFDRASKALLHCGFETESSREALLQLLQTAVINLKKGSPQEVLTGPVARGDSHVTREHIKALREVDPNLAELYADLATMAQELMHDGAGN